MENEETVDDYIARFPPEIRERLEAVRKTIKETAPAAQENISYRMPAYSLNGRLVYFAGFKNHIGIYPLTDALEEFKEELSAYKTGKGSVQFRHNEPLPTDLIKSIVEFRVRKNTGKGKD